MVTRAHHWISTSLLPCFNLTEDGLTLAHLRLHHSPRVFFGMFSSTLFQSVKRLLICSLSTEGLKKSKCSISSPICKNRRKFRLNCRSSLKMLSHGPAKREKPSSESLLAIELCKTSVIDQFITSILNREKSYVLTNNLCLE